MQNRRQPAYVTVGRENTLPRNEKLARFSKEKYFPVGTTRNLTRFIASTFRLDSSRDDIVSASKSRVNKHAARCTYESRGDVIKYPSARGLRLKFFLTERYSYFLLLTFSLGLARRRIDRSLELIARMTESRKSRGRMRYLFNPIVGKSRGRIVCNA